MANLAKAKEATDNPRDRYLNHVISQNRYLQLQGIRSGGRLVHIELEQIYITLRATQQRTVKAEEQWLAEEAVMVPGEQGWRETLAGRDTVTETVTVTVNEALANHKRLVVLGDPGSGKTTLLRYLALIYGRDLKAGSGEVAKILQLSETGLMPILLPLRNIGAFLQVRPDTGVDGHLLLLEFLWQSLQSERIKRSGTSQMPEPTLTELRQKIDKYFNEEELRMLCFDIGIEYESLGGRGKAANVQELVAHTRRHGMLPSLLTNVKAKREHVVWPKLPNRILTEVRANFFDQYLEQGKAVILLDGLDEVAGSDLRRRVSRLVEAFTRAYPECRYIVTSRIVGYTGAARLGEAYTTTTVRDFSLADVKQFLRYWHRLVAVGQFGNTEHAKLYAAKQTKQLLTAIENNERIRELAINPLMLTVLALVHRDRVKLPDRRAELYAEAVDVLLGKWDEARGIGVIEQSILIDKPFDIGDRRLMLQSIALHMHEQQQKEIEIDTLRRLLWEAFYEMVEDRREAVKAVERFLRVIEERTGLLVARGEGVYTFSHLTFQEYLAALAIVAQDDYVVFVLKRSPDSWWREAILLAVGDLSTRSRERTTRLIKAIADLEEEPEPYHNLVLAAECLRDVGGNRVRGGLEKRIQQNLRADIELDLASEIQRQQAEIKQQEIVFRQKQEKLLQNQPKTKWERFWRELRGETFDKMLEDELIPNFELKFDEELVIKEIIERKGIAMQALVRSGAGYWQRPYGEPEWIEIPSGSFLMGVERRKEHVDSFLIAPVPITNAQYYLFVQATDHKPPKHWQDGRPPQDKESHPVVYVTWHDAVAYCQWLSKATGKMIQLPTEVRWEKAARGDEDGRAYPWGDKFERTKCNTSELSVGDTTPVGIFPNGASLYGVLDMSGNVWEWIEGGRVVRGGSWVNDYRSARVMNRDLDYRVVADDHLGFRPVALGFSS